MRYDDILPEIGAFGLFQKMQYVLLCFPAALSMIYLLLGVFTLGVPKHRCDLSPILNISLVTNYSQTFPYQELHCEVDLDNYADLEPASLVAYRDVTTPNSRNDTPSLLGFGVGHDTYKCAAWDYDKSDYDVTATTEFNLVCDATYLRSVANMVLIGGIMLGTLVNGGLADRYGRKKILFVCSILTGITSFASAWSPNIYVYMVLRFITGLTPGGMYTASFILAMEMVGPSKRTWLGVGIQCACSIGSMTLVFLAYFIRNWRYLQIAVSLMSILIIPYWWLVQESARWLLAEGRQEEAKKVLKVMAKMNGSQAAVAEMLTDEQLSSITDIRMCNRGEEEGEEEEERPSKGSCIDVFKSKVLLPRSIVTCIIWLAVSLLYFGLSMNSVKLEGNLYLNFFILSLVEMPANVVSIFILNYIGRRVPQAFFLNLGGISCLGCFFILQYSGSSLAWLLLVVSTIGKFAASVAFGMVWIYATELFPTVTRSFSIGVFNMSARLGNMLAPLSVDAGEIIYSTFGAGLPQLLFGIIAMTSGLLGLLLPETKDKPLPETIEQAEQLGWGRSTCGKKMPKRNDIIIAEDYPENSHPS